MSRRTSLPHIGALDGLRGVAVIGVMLFHSELLRGGYLGVDLFFVLSGFLITSLLLAEHRETSDIALGAFWARRARRLLPALGLMLAGVLLYTAVFAEPTALLRIRDDALGTIGYVANWRMVFAKQSYFDLFLDHTPLEHTWSLAIEEQFYVIWPLLFLGIAAVARRRLVPVVLGVSVVLGLVSTGLMAWLYDPANTSRAYFGTDTRSGALFTGIALAAAIALWGHVRGDAARILLEAAAIVAAGVLAFMWSRVGFESPRLYRGGFLVAAVAAALVLAAAAHPRKGPIAMVLDFGPLRWFGLVSYGLYLWHWPVDVLLDGERTGLHGWYLFAVRSAVAIAIAAASYYLLELPIRRGAGSPAKWRLATPLLAAALVASTLVVTAGAIDLDQANPYPPKRGNDVLLVGDSVAQSLAPGLADEGVDLGLVWTPGCRLIHGTLDFANTYAGNCAWEPIGGGPSRAYEPKNALALVGVWDLFDVTLLGASRPVGPGSPQWNAVYRSRLQQLVRILGSRGAHVWLLTIPCAAGLNATFGQGAYDVNRVITANTIIGQVAAGHAGKVSVIDLFSELCPGGKFLPVIDGQPSRIDGIHLSASAADAVARWMIPQLGLGGTPAASTSTSPPPSPSGG